MRYAICALVLTLSACATSRPVKLADGTKGFAINCSGATRDIAECTHKASETCAGAYQMVDRNGSVVGSSIPPANNVYYMGAVHRTLIIRCRGRAEETGLASLTSAGP
jgi:hypothetical protein